MSLIRRASFGANFIPFENNIQFWLANPLMMKFAQ